MDKSSQTFMCFNENKWLDLTTSKHFPSGLRLYLTCHDAFETGVYSEISTSLIKWLYQEVYS